MASAKKIDIRKILGIDSNTVSASIELTSGRTIQEELEWYARILMGLLAKYINEAYKPDGNVRYHRSYGALIAAERYKMRYTVHDGTITVTCTMPGTAMHRSYFSPGSVNTLVLMDRGYRVKKPEMAKIPWFGHRPAGNIIQKTIDEFNSRINKLGVKAEITFE